MKNVLLLETVSENADRLLREEANVLGPAVLRDGAGVVHGIITRGKGDVSREVIESHPELEVIARCGVGLDNVDVAFATERGIRVINAPGVNADTVAEHTLGLMLMLSRRLYSQVRAVKEGNWAARNTYGGDELRGKTLGIIGMGNIGRRVGALAEAFGMRIVFTRSSGRGAPLDELLETSDIVSLHLPLTQHTKGLIGKREFKLMPEHALLVNTARGEIIQEKALYKALLKGRIAGFAADVLATEPPTDDRLTGLPNVLITPHIASLTARTYDQLCTITVQNALDVLAGRPIDKRYIFNHDQLNP